MKVFITRDIPKIGFDILRNANLKFHWNKLDKTISRKALINNVKECDGLICLLTDKIDKQVIDSMQRCRIVSNFAVGYDNIDVEYAKSKGIIVTNTPDVLTESTADLTITLILACSRRIFEANSLLREGRYKGWKPKFLLGMELKGKKLGILGAGRIGTAVALRAKSFGMKILYFSHNKNLFLEERTNAKKVSLNFILKNSDVISVHLPLNSETYHLLNKNRLSLLKKNAIVINTARGEIIDEKSLIRLLKLKKIKAAGLDVFEGEPNINRDLLNLQNVVVMPHIGSATVEARNGMAEIAAKNVVRVLTGKSPLTPV